MATSSNGSGETGMETDPTEDADSDNKDLFLLRQLNIKNFVKFKDAQELKFENGVYFLIGPNQTGKSSIFEAIRRCMSLECQSSVSSSPNKEEDSISVCTFKNETDTIYSFYILKANTDDQGGKANLDDEEAKANRSVKHDKTSHGDQVKPECVILKGCVFIDSNGTVKEFEMDRVEYRSGKFKKEELKFSPKQDPDVLKSETFSLDAFQTWISEQEKLIVFSPNQNDKSKTKCEAMMEEHVDKIICVFPMRAFGPLQWSKSSKIKNKEENYAEASQRAEVIMSYLKENIPSCTITREDKKNERLFYDYITGTENVNYDLDDDQSLQENASKNKPNIMVTTSENEHPHPILKMSEGFVDAKLCSILLAVSDFATVLLEDPGHGMHPQMIDRLCTTMTEKIKKNKVVIVSTHNSNFLKPWLMKNIFYFNKDSDNGFKVTSGQVFANDEDLQSAIPNKITMEQFSNFCYADTIVFVEGVSDQLFLEALARVLRKSDPKRDTRLQFGHLQFVNIDGHFNTMAFRNCCKKLDKRYAFVLDGDIWAGKTKEISEAILEEEKIELAKLKPHLSEQEKSNEIDMVKVGSQSEKEIENHFFKWKFKNLEALFFQGVLEENENTSMKTLMTNNKKKISKVTYKVKIEFEGEEEVPHEFDINRDGCLKKIQDKQSKLTDETKTIIENMCPDIKNGILNELKQKEINLTEEMKTILDKCFPDMLKFEKKSDDDYILCHIQKKKKTKKKKTFKLFLRGKETFDDRVKLVEFLLENADEIDGAGQIELLYKFVQKIDRGETSMPPRS